MPRMYPIRRRFVSPEEMIAITGVPPDTADFALRVCAEHVAHDLRIGRAGVEWCDGVFDPDDDIERRMVEFVPFCGWLPDGPVIEFFDGVRTTAWEVSRATGIGMLPWFDGESPKMTIGPPELLLKHCDTKTFGRRYVLGWDLSWDSANRGW